MHIEVYSDGSATVESSPGGYGWVMVIDGKKHDEGSGHMENASNNDAELQAAIMGLAAVLKFLNSGIQSYLMNVETPPTDQLKVTLVSDSQIVLNWANGTYRFKQLDKIKKYEQLRTLMQRLKADTRWVRGHSGDLHNERCDKLANSARKSSPLEEVSKVKRGPKIKSKFLDLAPGYKFGKLTIVENLSVEINSHSQWLCSCECGKTATVRSDSIARGHTKSCGCSRVKLGDGELTINLLLNQYKKSAEYKSLAFELKRDDFIRLITDNCYYCGEEPEEYNPFTNSEGISYSDKTTKELIGRSSLKRNGIDRLNSQCGYTVANCVSACKTCNMAKGTMGIKQFYKWIAKVYVFRYNKEIED